MLFACIFLLKNHIV